MRYDPPRSTRKLDDDLKHNAPQPDDWEPTPSTGSSATYGSERTLADQQQYAGQETPATDERRLSVLGPTLVFKGKLSAGEDLLIQGRVEGSIEHNERNLTIGHQGSVKADIRARNIIVQGQVQGDMIATESVLVEASAQVRGNIFAPRVGLKEGAKFKGSIDMDGEPAKAGGRKSKPTGGRVKSKAKSELSDAQIDELLE